MNDYILTTGVTGLLGQYLVRDLLLQGDRLVVVARRTDRTSPSERVEAVMQRWEEELCQRLPRPICFEGDLQKPLLGLNNDQLSWLETNCNRMLHCAASLAFQNEPSGEPRLTNVEGTRNVLDLCRRAAIEDLHYVSTAYVCGDRLDLVREDELDVGQSFRNDYEQSKLEAEKLVLAAGLPKRPTIYRPSVIAGDSQTGFTSTYHGLYLYLKLMSVLVWNTEPGDDGVRYTPVRLEMTGDEPRNIIPVDWASRVITHLLSNPEAHSRTFHLAPSVPITPREVIEAGYKYFNSRGVEFVGPRKEPGRISDMDEKAHNNMAIYSPYDHSDPAFDLTNLHKFAGHLPCPEIDDDMLHRFWRYGELDRWGKRRQSSKAIQFCVNEHLTKLAANADKSKINGNDARFTFGLNVLGPGGGQWRLLLRSSRITNVDTGLPSKGPVLTLPSDMLASACNGNWPHDRQWKSVVAEAGDDCLDSLTAERIADALCFQ